jgi:hypothetical protein
MSFRAIFVGSIRFRRSRHVRHSPLLPNFCTAAKNRAVPIASFQEQRCADEKSRPAPYRVHWLVVYPDLKAAGGTCRSSVFSAAAPVLAAGIELKTSNFAVIYHAHRAPIVYR